ncbi:MAG: GspE/PulE family protein [Patescibacteria group bacterium]
MAKNIIDILVGNAILKLKEGSDMRREAKEKNVPLDDILYLHGITERDVAEAKGTLTGYPVKYLNGELVSGEVFRDIPEESARYYKMVPLGKRDGIFEVGMLNPDDVSAQEALKFISARIDLPVRVFIIIPSDFETLLKQYKSLPIEVTRALGVFEKEKTPFREGLNYVPEKKGLVEEAPITKIVTVVLRYAVEGHASDIHIEPGVDILRVRFRVDGILHTSLTLPKETHAPLVSRIKILCNLKIDENRVPQDGRFHAEVMDRGIDFRVSTLPTAFGEKVVIRILDSSGGIADLGNLGLEGMNLELVKKNLDRPYGLILITGPTGSGKSTTLYAMLQILNKETTNIVSLEDPIEYFIPGVNQSQVRPEINYDFATGLRHVVRQDPDIIMVGEIRDKETAQLAIQAALTGHLVLATLHTNNAIGVIPRLVDMGVDPFLIAPTLILAIAQRLVRKLCPDSRKAFTLEGNIKDMIIGQVDTLPDELQKSVKATMPNDIYGAESSPVCPKGTRGRMGIFEVIAMTPELEQIILQDLSEANIIKEALRQGMITMKQDGIIKILRGVIGYEELIEVI